MKNRNLAKVLVLVLSLALLIGSVAAINVSAETEEIAGVSIVHGAKIQIAIAANAGATVTYKWGAEGETLTAIPGEVIESTNAAVNGKTAYLTDGVAYYELGKVCYINVNGEEITYSVAQFLFAQLYRDKVTGDAKTCYEALLALGDASQIHLKQNADVLPSESTYVYTKNADITINNDNFAFAPTGSEATVTLAYNGAEEYTGFQIGALVVAKNKAANLKVAGVSEVSLYYDEISGYGTDFETSVTTGVKLATGSAVIQDSFILGETYTPATKSGVWGNIVEVTKKFENGREEVSNVLKLTINDGSSKNTTLGTLGGEGSFYYAPTISSNDGNIHVLEFDFNWAQASKKGFRNPISLFAYDANGNMLGNIVDANGKDDQYCVWTINNGGAFTEGTVVENAYQLGISGTQVEQAGGKFRLFNSDTWYRLRYIWNESTGEVYISASDDNGATWYQACTMQTKKAYADTAYLAFSCDQLYGLGGYVYLDNINYDIVSELPELPENNGL